MQLAMQLSKSFMEQESSVPERTQQTEASVMDQSSIVSEEDEIQRAIAMSLEGKFFIISKPKQYKLNFIDTLIRKIYFHSIYILPLAELKPAAKDQQTKVKPSASTSSQMSPKKNTKTQGDNSSLGASGTSTSATSSKSLGNPGWPSKTENPIITPSNTSSANKGR